MTYREATPYLERVLQLLYALLQQEQQHRKLLFDILGHALISDRITLQLQVLHLLRTSRNKTRKWNNWITEIQLFNQHNI